MLQVCENVNGIPHYRWLQHLYYFSCLAPSIWFAAHPLVMLFNGIHLVLSPACSHSGYEDHWQSDQFHYLHVRIPSFAHLL